MGHFLVPYIVYEYTILAHERGTKLFLKGGVHHQNPTHLYSPLRYIPSMELYTSMVHGWGVGGY
jgi:hypothetical protein